MKFSIGNDHNNWEEVGGIEELEVVEEQPTYTFQSFSGTTRKVKGARDAGMLKVLMHYDPVDPAQIMFDCAQASTKPFKFKLETDDETYEFEALVVMSVCQKLGGITNIVMKEIQLAISSVIRNGVRIDDKDLPNFDHSWADVLNDSQIAKLFRGGR